MSLRAVASTEIDKPMEMLYEILASQRLRLKLVAF